MKQKAYHDQYATYLPTLVPGQEVTILKLRTHTKLNIVSLSYVVSTPTKGELSRNRSQIRESHSKKVRFNLDQDTENPPVKNLQVYERSQPEQAIGNTTCRIKRTVCKPIWQVNKDTKEDGQLNI